MKKTIIITVVIIAVLAIVYFVFGKSESKEKEYSKDPDKKDTDNKIGNMLKSEVTTESVLDAVGKDTAVTNEISYLIGLTDGEKSNYKQYCEYIKLKTGEDFSGKSYETVKVYFEEVKEMEDLAAKIKEQFGVDVDITKTKSNELKEIQSIYDENDKLLQQAAISYAKEFYKLFWLDNAFNITKKNKGTRLDSYKGFNAATLNNLMSLPKEYAKLANDYVKANWENKKFTIAPKKNEFGTYWADSQDVNLSGKSIVDALQVSSFMLKERDKKTSPQGLAQRLIDLYKNEYFL